MRVSGLHIYPVKSTRGHSVEAASIDALGMAGDRRAAFLDIDGNVLEQRDTPMLAQITARQTDAGLLISKEGQSDILVRPAEWQVCVKVWEGYGKAFLADDAASQAISKWFDQPVRIAFINSDSAIPVDETWQGQGATTGFTDGYPILITNTASLTALNAFSAEKGEGPVDMGRFRANIVVDCDIAWDEDWWEAVEIGGIRYDLVKPCARCVMTTQDQMTGSREAPNPMPAMQHLRLSMDRRVVGPLFGWNAIARGQGPIQVGDEVKVLSRRSEKWPLKAR